MFWIWLGLVLINLITLIFTLFGVLTLAMSDKNECILITIYTAFIYTTVGDSYRYHSSVYQPSFIYLKLLKPRQDAKYKNILVSTQHWTEWTGTGHVSMSFAPATLNRVRMEEIKHQMSIHRQNLLFVCK